MLARVRRRHVAKGPGPGCLAQEPLPSLPELDAEKAGAKRQVYLVTFPHPRSAVGLDGAPLAHHTFRFASVKKALHDKFGLASHWSCTHTGYWSAVKYCAVPSPKKTHAALDTQPKLWARQGSHPPLHLCCHEPATAAAMSAKRRRAEHDAAEESKADPRFTEYDLWPIVAAMGRGTDGRGGRGMVGYGDRHGEKEREGWGRGTTTKTPPSRLACVQLMETILHHLTSFIIGKVCTSPPSWLPMI